MRWLYCIETRIKESFVLPVLTAGLVLILAGQVTAQTFTTLHSFAATIGIFSTNSEGADPRAGLVLSSNTLYGTAAGGGSAGAGTVFKVNTDGSGFTNLHSFTGVDGANPNGRLILSGNTLCGTAFGAGTWGEGTLFKVNTDGTGFTNLHIFTAIDQTYYTNSDGAAPYSGLVLSRDTLYGAAAFGGAGGEGTLFKVNTDGTGFSTLYSFTATSGNPYYINSDGTGSSELILSGDTLYGTSLEGGLSGKGTVFRVNTNGAGFTTLHNFTATSFDPASPQDTNSDGANPYAGLVLSDNTLYGTAYSGGSSGFGTVFALNTDGTGFTNLHSFSAAPFPYTNSDGASPFARLILSGHTLQGTARSGGSSGNGALFAVNTDGTGFTNLHSFTARSSGTNSEGAYPQTGLILAGNTLYGTASGGGRSGNGTVFSLSFTPQLITIPSGPNLILTWPTNYAGFDYTGYTIQSTINLGPLAVWTTNSPAPVVINGQNTVTNPISGTQQFFRLSQ